MKSFALSMLYVSSIVLAVGIGMAQVGKESLGGNGSAHSDCNYRTKDSPNCLDFPASLLPCEKTYEDAYGQSEKNYRLIARNQCGGWGLTPLLDPNGNPTGYYTLPEIFIPDPKCGVQVTTPTSDGCSE